MYTIGNLIFGTPISDSLSDLFEEVYAEGAGHPLYDFLDESSFCGFQTLYSGDPGLIPGFFGEKVWNFNAIEFTSFEALKTLSESFPLSKREEVIRKFNLLPEEIRNCCDPLEFYLVWSSS